MTFVTRHFWRPVTSGLQIHIQGLHHLIADKTCGQSPFCLPDRSCRGSRVERILVSSPVQAIDRPATNILAVQLARRARHGLQGVRLRSVSKGLQVRTSFRRPTVTSIAVGAAFAASGLLVSTMWVPTSSEQLEEVEARVLTKVKSNYESRFVELENGETVRMLVVSPGKPGIPLVLVHGFGAAVGCWVKNFDELAEDRTVYAIDQVGFGRSSRPPFSEAADEAEEQLVEGLELWRRAMGLQSFILLGHSLGGYVSVGFALRYPQYVRHLILADPWGMPQRPSESDSNWPLGYRVLRSIITRFNLLAILRAAGPAGPRLFQRARADLQEVFADYFPDMTMMDYLYHCNAQEPSGEIAMKSLNKGFGWAENPMLPRLDQLDKRICLSFIYGEHSWMNPLTGCVARERFGQDRVSVDMVPNATHHVFATSGVFNFLVKHYCKVAESGKFNTSKLIGHYGDTQYKV